MRQINDMIKKQKIKKICLTVSRLFDSIKQQTLNVIVI